MAEQQSHTIPASGKPLQRVSWAEKTKDKFQWFKNTADWYLKLCNFNFDGTGANRKDIRQLYQVYNGQYPAKWFNHITDPLNARNNNHKKWPAKIRPVNMLRTNIDLLLGEYPRRPFVYQVLNTGGDGYNSFTEALQAKIQENLTQHFVAMVQQQAAEQGLPAEQVPGLDEIELPESVKENFGTSYKDAKAIRGQKFMNRAIKEYRVRQELHRAFKDWLIAGQGYTYKAVERSQLIYERVSPVNLDYDKSPDVEFIEDGEWAVCRRLWTVSDCVDHFYDELKDEEWLDLETRNSMVSPTAFFQYLTDQFNKDLSTGKVPVFHIVWKGKRKVLKVTYFDQMTGAEESFEADEDYIPNKDLGEKAEVMWANEVYETWKLGDRIYTRMRAVPYQRNALNNSSACKLPYNGRRFSDVHAENISPMELGLPFQLMYMITNRTLEMTIAKSKGKILLIDKNAIPRGDGWDDEKFFYYGEALGYGLMNRNQQGVDKTWNQYQVLDMSLFDQIKQLIELQEHFKQQWDDLIGINRPRKGATYASDGKAVSEMGLMQSSVITDSIFYLFEQFVEKDLQGILDLSKFVDREGNRKIYNQDDYDATAYDVDDDTYSMAQLGILMSNATDEQAIFNKMEAQVQNMLQAGTKPSTALEIFRAQNIAQLAEKLRKIEDMQAEMDQQQYQSQDEIQKAADQRKMEFEQFRSNLEEMKEKNLIDKEWDRRDQNEMIKGEYGLYEFGGDGDNNDNGVPDAMEIEDRIITRQQHLTDERLRREEMQLKEKQHQRDANIEMQKMKSAERIAAEKNRTAIRTAKYKSKKPKQ